MRINSINQSLYSGVVLNRNTPLKSNNLSEQSNYSDKPVYYAYPVFKSNYKKGAISLSKEVEKAFYSKDYNSKKKYFDNLLENHSLVLRNCDDEEYIKTVQVMLDNVKYNNYCEKELFETQVNILSAMVRPDVDIDKFVNPDKFSSNLKDCLYDDEGVVNKINRILTLTKAKDSQIVLDINSHSKYPVNVLSNFADTEFKFDGVNVRSMEGFLQSLKVNDTAEQKDVCKLSGLRAKGLGKKLNKQRNYDFKNLFWQGQKINRNNEEYHDLLKAAYRERFNQDDDFLFALEYTKNYKLEHSLGGKDPNRTLLTEKEFINILDDLRKDV